MSWKFHQVGETGASSHTWQIFKSEYLARDSTYRGDLPSQNLHDYYTQCVLKIA